MPHQNRTTKRRSSSKLHKLAWICTVQISVFLLEAACLASTSSGNNGITIQIADSRAIVTFIIDSTKSGAVTTYDVYIGNNKDDNFKTTITELTQDLLSVAVELLLNTKNVESKLLISDRSQSNSILQELRRNNCREVTRKLFLKVTAQWEIGQLQQALLKAKETEKVNIGIIRRKADKIHGYAKRISSFSVGDFIKNSLPVPWIFTPWAEDKDTLQDDESFDLSVSEIQIGFENGDIRDIQVQCNLPNSSPSNSGSNWYFRLSHPVPVRTPSTIEDLNKPKHLRLWRKGDTTDYYIFFSDVIDFKRNVLEASGSYFPIDTAITIPGTATSGNVEHTVKLYNKSFWDNVDIRIYTDMTGLSRNNPNGLVQVEGEYSIWQNSSGSIVKDRLFPFNKMSVFLAFTKIEEENRAVPTRFFNAGRSSDRTKPQSSYHYASTFDMYRFSFFRAGISESLLGFISPTSKIYVNLHLGFYRTLTDTTFNVDSVDTSETDIVFGAIQVPKESELTSWLLMPEVQFIFQFNRKFHFDTRVGLIYSQLIDDAFRTADGRLDRFLPESEQPRNTRRRFSIASSILKWELNLNYYSQSSSGTQDGKFVFLRSTLFWDTPQSNLSLQLGFSSPISELLDF